MSLITATPPRRAHAFINHSPETYEAELKRQQPSVKKELNVGLQSSSHQASKSPVKPRNASLGASQGPELLSQIYSDPSPSPDSSVDASHPPGEAPPSKDEPAAPTRTVSFDPSTRRDSSQSNSSQSSQSSQSDPSGPQLREAPRKRRRTSPNELHILETEFARNSKPCKDDRERIANLTSMDEKAVQVWFQNKRQSCRRQQSQGHIVTPAIVRAHSMPMGFQDENTFQIGMQFDPTNKAFFGAHRPPMPAAVPVPTEPTFAVMQAKRAKSLKLSMSADGKAELIERSPLKQLQGDNRNGPLTGPLAHNGAMPAMHFATMPTFSPQLSGFEQECASSLLVLKSGQRG